MYFYVYVNVNMSMQSCVYGYISVKSNSKTQMIICIYKNDRVYIHK